MKTNQTIIPIFSKRKGKQRRFTMIELLTVMIILSVVLAMLMPAFERMAIGAGVQGGARAVGGQLRMARQYAMAHRERIAVLMPAGDHTVQNNDLQELMEERQWSAYRACIVNAENEFVDWVPNTEWQHLPTGSIIAQISGSDDLADPPDDDATVITNIDETGNGSVDYTNVRAVVFSPTGRLAGMTARRIIVVEGAVDNGNMVIRNRDNFRLLEVDEYTGRVSYKDEHLNE